MASYRPKIKLNASGETRDLPLDAETLKGKTLDYFASKDENDKKANKSGDVITTMNNQYFILNNKFGINMGNSDIVGINSLVFEDPLDTPDEGILFPKIYSPGNLLENYNLFKVDGVGQPFVNENKIYHQGFKPTKTDVGLGNVDNTSDANKPISTATQNALNGKTDNGTLKGQRYNEIDVSYERNILESNNPNMYFNYNNPNNRIDKYHFCKGTPINAVADIRCGSIDAYNVVANNAIYVTGSVYVNNASTRVATVTELNQKIDKPKNGQKYGMYRHSCSASTADGTFYFDFWCNYDQKLTSSVDWQYVNFWGGSGAISNIDSAQNSQQTSVFKKGTQLFYYVTNMNNHLSARFIDCSKVSTSAVYDFFGNKVA